jgi:hypothetical protein
MMKLLVILIILLGCVLESLGYHGLTAMMATQ